MAHQVLIFATAGSPAAYDMSDAFSTSLLRIKIPYPCFNPPSVAWATENFQMLVDETAQGSPGNIRYYSEQLLENIWQGVKNDPRWLELSANERVDPPSIIQEGEHSITCSPFNRLDIEFLQIPERLDYWWNSYSFAKFGVLMLGSSPRSMPAIWLNSPFCSIPCKIGTDFTVILPPGAIASIQPVPPVQPPQLEWDHFGGAGVWPDPARDMFVAA